ncbi:metal-dependent hydrolase [Halovenus marina]|uniref:metal-dependent hydrolase n=1 Tax=Halovenus marina TaxID=3396621 RepID=UPI003F56C883
MPSTLVHLALAGMVAAALLGTAYGWKALLVVFAVTAFADLDSFIALVWDPAHRAALHTLVIPVGLGVLLWVDLRIRERSFVLDRWGYWGLRVAWVSLLCYAVVAILFDMTDGSANLLWPLHDQFYALDGKIELSNQRGIVQTFFESDSGAVPAPEPVGSTDEVVQNTGVNPAPAEDGGDPERIFPVIGAAWELLVVVCGSIVTLARFRLSPSLADEE